MPAGSSAKPLAEKLGIKEGFAVLVIHPPKGYKRLLGRLPNLVTIPEGPEAEPRAVSSRKGSHRSRRHLHDPSAGRSGLGSVPEDIPAHARTRRADSRIHFDQGLHGRGRRGDRSGPLRERGFPEGMEGAAGTSRGAAPRPRGVLRSLLRPGLQGGTRLRVYDRRPRPKPRIGPRPGQAARSFISLTHAPPREVV